ncbi:hypothetical protein BaRGS_00014577 [Batillaria attramentaria]|uniref:Uncharacterized protein n=1 Tax=Batillaria attramentaria TaxID=370345 RepID=A0ABD0L3W8_9CAEN
MTSDTKTSHSAWHTGPTWIAQPVALLRDLVTSAAIFQCPDERSDSLPGSGTQRDRESAALTSRGADVIRFMLPPLGELGTARL